jgi:hypothetical protein
MGVRKTESRIPANFKPDDLGQAVVAADGRCALVSFITSPLVIDRENVYVVFITDTALAAVSQSFEWSFTDNEGIPDTQTTQYGEIFYRPKYNGHLNLIVRILAADNTEQASLTLDQEVVATSAELEILIAGVQNESGPSIANTDVLRELINQHNHYYQIVTLKTLEEGNGFQRFVFSMLFDGALQRTTAQRKHYLDQLALSLNSQGNDFAILTAGGVGICGIRMALLAMTLPQNPGSSATLIDWTELPEPAPQRAFADEQLRQNLAALNENIRIDLFNLLRFPKSNITQCGHVLETLRNRYFSGANFNDVLTGMSGTRKYWITRHFREGPLLRS